MRSLCNFLRYLFSPKAERDEKRVKWNASRFGRVNRMSMGLNARALFLAFSMDSNRTKSSKKTKDNKKQYRIPKVADLWSCQGSQEGSASEVAPLLRHIFVLLSFAVERK